MTRVLALDLSLISSGVALPNGDHDRCDTCWTQTGRKRPHEAFRDLRQGAS